MKKNLILKKFLLVILPLSIIGCANKSTNNTSFESQVDLNTFEGILEYLSKEENYTLKTDKGEIKYLNDAYFSKLGSEEVGYIKCSEGVYRLDKVDLSYVGSKLLQDAKGNKYLDIYDSNELVTSFSSFQFDFTKIDKVNSTYVISEKANVLKYLKMLNISVADYPLIKDITMKLEDQKFVIDLSYVEGKTTRVSVLDIGKTQIAEVTEYLKTNSYYVNTNDENKIIDLFSSFNYKRVCVDVDNVTPIGYEWYNKRYFYGEWEDEYYKEHLGEIYEIGVIGFDKVTYQNQLLDGSYYFNYDETNVQVITTAPINTNSDVTEIYNYPTYMSLFDNFHLFQVDENYQNTIYTTNYELMNDFCVNFQLVETLNVNNCSISSLEIAYDFKDEDKESTVWFNLYYVYQGQLGAFSYPFTAFGDANIEIVEKFILEVEGEK